MSEIKSPTFHVRDLPIYGDAILAPMDGYSDWPFRSLCRELGSAMSYTEFVKVTFTFLVRFVFVSSTCCPLLCCFATLNSRP